MDYSELREVVNNIENKKDKQHVNFAAKHLVI